MLEGLPKEVFWMILNQVSDRRDFTQLCAVSKTLYDLTLPKLYETVVISPESEKNLERINIKPFLIGNSTARLHYAKHVRISAPFHDNLDERCIHFRDIDDQIKHDFDEELEAREAGGRKKFRKLEASILTILEQLKDESLKSFSWELGTCIPSEILSSDGYLPCEQTSLEAITLITGIGCPDETDDWNAVDLSQFCALRRISWIGMQTDLYRQALRDALQKNSKHLTHLRLEHVPQDDDSDDSDGSDDDDGNGGDRRAYCRNLFSRECLGLTQSNATTEAIFPALNSLSLGFLPLKNAETALVHALNIRKLSHLTLRQCPGMEEFLRGVIESGSTLRLLSLEYSCGLSGEVDVCSALEGIFGIAPDLTDLFLSLPGPIFTLDIWRALANNRLPLTRFIYHQRSVNLNEDSSRFEEEEDLTDLSLLPEDMDELERAGEQHPFAQFNLVCLGLSGSPFIVKSILTSPEATNSLTLLHIRKSGSDLAGRMESRGKMFEYPDLMSDSEDENGDEDDPPQIDDNEDLEAAAKAPMAEDSAPTDITRDSLPSRPFAPPMTASAVRDAEDDADLETMYELRKLPRNILPFARWAFGADGIPSLQVLAYGDFSFDGRFEAKNHILCRKSWTIPKQKKGNTSEDDKEDNILPFRPMRHGDKDMMELVSQNMDFLGACPLDSIVINSP